MNTAVFMFYLVIAGMTGSNTGAGKTTVPQTTQKVCEENAKYFRKEGYKAYCVWSGVEPVMNKK